MSYKDIEKNRKSNKKYYENHREEILAKHKKWRKNNQDYIKEYNRNHRLVCSDEIKEYRENHRDEKKKYNKEYYQNHRNEILKQHKEYKEKYRDELKTKQKNYYKNHRDEIFKRNNEYIKKRRKTDLKFNLNNKISKSIRYSLKNNKNCNHWENLVDYSINDLIKHLKSTMPEGYTWNDYINGRLHIDHIIPISVFNFTNTDHIDFKRCWSLKNLRLLTAKENISKQDKLSIPFQPALKI